MLKPTHIQWELGLWLKTYVASGSGDFYGSEKSVTLTEATDVKLN
jgi:monomeric isocitrate dehydrogenase